MYPLSLRWTKSRGPIIMIIIWGSAFGLSSFQLIHGKAEKFVMGGQEIYDCTEVWEELDGKGCGNVERRVAALKCHPRHLSAV
ncbi:uncharacterized protein TNCV_503721 [Trichonephila clavipes]|nr:uncharacterized protein TNCV_503721 [Trichonephila clavipes]